MKVTDRDIEVIALNATRGSYAYLILGTETMLIDSGRPDQRRGILKELERMNIPLESIKHIFLTHHDIDHIGNAAVLQQLTGCKVWASERDVVYIKREVKRPGIKHVIETIANPAVPQNLHTYNESLDIKGVKAISTPGHTPGHVCILHDEVLFAGDLVHLKNGRLEPYSEFWNWDSELLKTSIMALSNVSFQWICPAHSRSVERGLFDDLISRLSKV